MFDQNSVGSDTHFQFTKWTVDQTGAYRCAADTHGCGFLLGDGALRYGHENIVEAYYTPHIWRGLWVASGLWAIASLMEKAVEFFLKNLDHKPDQLAKRATCSKAPDKNLGSMFEHRNVGRRRGCGQIQRFTADVSTRGNKSTAPLRAQPCLCRFPQAHQSFTTHAQQRTQPFIDVQVGSQQFAKIVSFAKRRLMKNSSGQCLTSTESGGYGQNYRSGNAICFGSQTGNLYSIRERIDVKSKARRANS